MKCCQHTFTDVRAVHGQWVAPPPAGSSSSTSAVCSIILQRHRTDSMRRHGIPQFGLHFLAEIQVAVAIRILAIIYLLWQE